MNTHLEHRLSESSLRSKLAGVFALVFFLLAFVGQGCHSHSLPHLHADHGGHVVGVQTDQSTTLETDTAETCSLCVAMHSAAPASVHTADSIAPVRANIRFEHKEVHRDEPIAFARLSRPPPTLSRAA